MRSRILVRIKTRIAAIAASLIDRFAASVAFVRRGYGLQIVCSGMIYEQHRTTADYNGNSLRNWPDEKIIVRRADLAKSALVGATVSFFFFL